LTKPVSGAIFAVPATITLIASASDSDGTISKVEFYNGSVLLGAATTPPYSLVWNNVAGGAYSLTAKATDNAGVATTSTGVTITVAAGSSPFGSTPWPIPGRIEAENYDLGGEAVAYHDANSANSGGRYRLSEGVDIEVSMDTDCSYHVGSMLAGEWLRYTVNV